MAEAVLELAVEHLENSCHRLLSVMARQSSLGRPSSLRLDLSYLDRRDGRGLTSGTHDEMVLQSVDLESSEIESNISPHRVNNLAVALVEDTPTTFWSAIDWLAALISFALTLVWPFGGPSYTGYYEAYTKSFSERPWVASSPLEPSLYESESQKNPLPTPHEATDLEITYASCPRFLMLYDVAENCWSCCSDREILKHQFYVAVSYRQSDFFTKGEGEREQREILIESIQQACLGQGYSAYWLDCQCIGESEEEKNLNLYCIADVFRSAWITLIMIKETGDGWKSWGSRVWTLPEALLSLKLYYKVGTKPGPVRRVTLRQIANLAYEGRDKEMTIINEHNGNGPLGRIERLMLLKDAIWRRSSGSPSQPSPTTASSGEFIAYPAEKVYALMGFFEHRIKPNRDETELQALGRLFVANYNDQFLARMVSILPPVIPQTNCWYSDEDFYLTKLWDVKPCIQVPAISKTGAAVLSDCRAAVIKWDGFPEVALQMKISFKHFICRVLPHLFWLILLMGLGLLAVSMVLGIFIIGVSLTLLFISPWLVIYGHTGYVEGMQPWLIGVEGIVKPEEVSQMMWGSTVPSQHRFSHEPRHSPYIPDDADIRQRNPLQTYPASRTLNVYTLIDTVSCSVYYFQARRTPTVCVFTGLEGGIGRFVLCSESAGHCEGELHRESVLRMPIHVGDMMRRCSRIAIGGLGDVSE